VNSLEKKVIVFTVREAIEFCIENKMNSAIAQLESFDKNGKLATNQKKKLMANLECLANEVIITGGGKSGKVILKGLKVTPTERITGNSRNGRQLSVEDEIMKEFLFNSLCLTYNSFDISRSFTVNQLINLSNLMPVTNKESVEIEKEISRIFLTSYKKEQGIYIKSNASNNLRSFQKRNVKLYIKHLVAEGRIHVEDSYMVKYLEDSFVVEMLKEEFGNDFRIFNQISEEEFLKVKANIKDIAEDNGFTYAEYVQSTQKLIKIDNKVQKMINEVKAYLEVSGFDYLFIIMNITILQPVCIQKITREEARKAFEKKIIMLTNERMKKEKYNNRTQYTKEFYRLAMFVMLQKLGVEGLEKYIEKEISMIPQKVEEMYKKYHGIKPTFEEIIAESKNDLNIADILPTSFFDGDNQQELKIEEKSWKDNNSLPFGNDFNIKPDKFMIPMDSFGEYEQHSEEELEMMRAEYFLENNRLEYY